MKLSAFRRTRIYFGEGLFGMRFYGYKNSFVNRYFGTTEGGEWVRVSFVRFIFLWLFRYMVKVEK